MKRHHWHSRAHKTWGKERLYFWRLRFHPVYEREPRVHKLLEVLAAHRVTSYALYEVFGEWDLLVRLWLPSDISSRDFGEALAAALEPLQLHKEDHFSVDDIIRHWVWGDEEMARPEDARMLEPPPADSDIVAVNRGRASPTLFRRLRGEGLVRRVEHRAGVKFAMVVTQPTADLSIAQRRKLRKEITRLVDRAAGVKERSLYEGHGFGSFLILGRVPHQRFDAIRDAVADPISMTVAPDAFGARTYTMIVASKDFLHFEEVLPLQQQIRAAEEEDIRAALERPEGPSLEVKGSAYLDFRRYLEGDGKRKDELKILDEGVLKAVTALLNSEGGTVVIGALERERLKDPHDRLAGLPIVGRYVCPGIEYDWIRVNNWDGYERRLLSALASRIEPEPLLWINLSSESVEGRMLAKIHINRPDRYWYYLKTRAKPPRRIFNVRRGSESVELEGLEADRYRQEHPRG